MYWCLLSVYVAVTLAVLMDKYDDGYEFPQAAARALIWPFVFVARVGYVMYRCMKEVTK